MQNNLLAVETTGLYPTVSILKDGEIFEESSYEELNHLQSLAPMVKSLLDKHNMTPEEIEGVLMSSGPGSFTGIRIGLAFGKAFSLSLGIDSYVESSLKMLAYQKMEKDLLVCPILDGRKGRVFSSLYKGMEMSCLIEEDLYDLDVYLAKLKEYSHEKILFVGDGVFPNYASLSEFNKSVFVDNEFLKSSTILKYYLKNSSEMKSVLPNEIEANYLRKSEAELHRKAK